MKRHIQVAMLGLIVLVVGVLAACGGASPTPTPSPDPRSDPLISAEEYRETGDAPL